MKRHYSWRKTLTIISLCLYLMFAVSPPAFASIHKYPETADRVMFRSVQSLRDTEDKAWQVVLYKRVKSGVVNSKPEISRVPRHRIAAPCAAESCCGKAGNWQGK